MELTLGNLKEVLLKTIGQDILNEGFIFSKSNYQFRKKEGKNKAEILFFFFDYKPSWLEFRYTIYFYINEIENESNKFFKFLGLERVSQPTQSFFEGDFHADTKNLEFKYRIDYTHRIFDIDKDDSEIEYSRKLLRDEFIPRISTFTDIGNYQEYVLSNYEVIENGVQLLPALIAAKLKGINELEKMVSYLLQKAEIIELESTDLRKRVITEILSYAKSH
jgi:hypothetical protein